MRRHLRLIMSVLLLVSTSSTGSPNQLLNTEAKVILGHYHLNVTSVEEHSSGSIRLVGPRSLSGPTESTSSSFPVCLNVAKPPNGTPLLS